MEEQDLIHDWNEVSAALHARTAIELDDESLRDGLQSPSVTLPSIEDRKRLLHLMADLGIGAADIGLPGAGSRFAQDVLDLAREIAVHRLPIAPNCAGRTVIADIVPIAEAAHKTGLPIEASLFIGSSPIREFVEGWTIDQMQDRVGVAVSFARREGLEVMFVTEDTTRARPDHLRRLYSTAIECGARRICLADTVGHATPSGVRALVRFAKQLVEESGEAVKIDWHGHHDRGLSLINALVAIEEGVHRIHATALGVGERCGNVSMEHLLVNLRLLGLVENGLDRLCEYSELVSKAWGVPIPANYPVVGRDAFRTSTGVHAAAVIKARKAGNHWLSDRVYSGVPAQWIGSEQCIEIGPMSGASNVTHWFERHEITPSAELVQCVLDAAKQGNQNLTDAQIAHLIAGHG